MYFIKCTTLDELKKEYKRLAFIHHPDRGGSTATMQAINAEYKAAFDRLNSNTSSSFYGGTQSAHTTTKETAADFITIINKLLSMDGLEIELCGKWLWIGGNTRKHKDTLKAAGCTWCSKKKLWAWHYPEDVRITSKRASMDHIREKYGSTVIKANNAATMAVYN